MKTLEEMNKDERSLLLFFETCAVDHGGAVHTQHMNSDDMELAKQWDESGFISFGRIASDFLPLPSGRTHCCGLSDEAWSLAHAERRSRYARINATRKWATTAEKRAAQPCNKRQPLGCTV